MCAPFTPAQAPPGPEKTLTLASIVAPRLARRNDASSRDEAFAKASRESLRAALIGRKVTFRVEYKIDSIDREFGVVFDEKGVNASAMQVKRGLCKVRVGGGERASNAEELEALERQAQAEEVGMWSKDPAVLAKANAIKVSHEMKAEDVLSSVKMRPTPGVVEHVLNGGTVKLTLTGDGAIHDQSVVVSIGGISVHSIGRKGAKNEDGTEQGPEPFALEARHFTEMALLHRDVRVILEGLDRRGNFIGSILPADINDTAFVNVAEGLCRMGLAQVHEASAAALIGGAGKLRAAEKIAKDQQLCLWRGYVPPVPSIRTVTMTNFEAHVIEIISGDCISVAPTSGPDMSERRINLSSIRAPRLANPRDEKAMHEPWAVEAKEFLISRLVGRTVSVSMDYVRKIGEGTNERTLHFATVKLPGTGDEAQNVAEMLLIRGLASCIHHRSEEERAADYDGLVAAAKRGIENKKGMHNKNKEPAVHRMNDFSVSSQKAKTFLPFLQRAGKCSAIVDFVAAGHKVRVSIPKEGAVISFCLAGVRCPRRDEPYAAQALEFTRTRILQRTVEIVVDSVDKTGIFLGTLFADEGRLNLGEELLRAGLGSLHPAFPVERVQGGRALAEIEAAAKEVKAGLWKDWTPPVQVEETREDEPTGELVRVDVTECVAGGRFFVQKLDGCKIEEVTSKLADLYGDVDTSKAFDGVFEPKVGDAVAAKFTGDDKWSRAIVASKRIGDKPVRVFYCDYGNTEELPFKRLRPLKDAGLTLNALPPMANFCALSSVKIPRIDSDYGYAAASRVGELLSGRLFHARIDARDRFPTSKPWESGAAPAFTLALFPSAVAAPEESVACDLLRSGLARVDRRPRVRDRAELDAMRDAQESARRAREGMWQYGDVDSDSDADH